MQFKGKRAGAEEIYKVGVVCVDAGGHLWTTGHDAETLFDSEGNCLLLEEGGRRGKRRVVCERRWRGAVAAVHWRDA